MDIENLIQKLIKSNVYYSRKFWNPIMNTNNLQMKQPITFSLRRTRTHSRDSSSPKSSIRMTKKPRVCHSERSEESRALLGRIINETSIFNKFVTLRNDYMDVTSDN